jgi:hypothetical protein
MRLLYQSGLPDGIFSYENPPFWYILECLEMENFEIFTTNWYTVWSFALFLVYFVVTCYIFPILVNYIKNSGNHDTNTKSLFKYQEEDRIVISVS